MSEKIESLVIRDRCVVSIDCETTGLHVEKGHRIVEVALVKHHPNGRVEEWSSLVNPECEMTPSNVAIHGISNSMVSKAPLFKNVWPTIRCWIKDAIIIAHNAPFDIGFLQSEVSNINAQMDDVDILDTLLLSRRFFGFPRNNLSAVSHRFHLMTPNAHRALPDARNTLHIFWAMLDDIEVRNQQQLTSRNLRQLCEHYEKRGPFRNGILKAIIQAHKNKSLLNIDYISRDPNKPIRTQRTIEVTRWNSPYLEANCFLRGEPRRFHLKQIQRAEICPQEEKPHS